MTTYAVFSRRRLFYYGSDRETASLRHRDNVGSRLYKDGVLLSTRVTDARAERALRVHEGIDEELTITTPLAAYVHRRPKQ